MLRRNFSTHSTKKDEKTEVLNEPETCRMCKKVILDHLNQI